MKKLLAIMSAGALLATSAAMAEAKIDVLPGDFLFASGAGAWGTEMTLKEDMTFSGNYSDSEMGETGEGYEYGSCYICSFSGSFSTPEAQDDGTCTLTVTSLSYANEPGGETIDDSIRYVYEEAYGIAEGDEFIYYPAGYATADMEEGAVEWAALTNAWGEDIPETLENAVLYNATQDYAFSQQVFED